MRARNLKPAFFKNEDLAELPFEYRLLFQGLWCLADREGRFQDRPKRIKADVFPYDNVDVVKGITELADAGFLLRYEVSGHKYVQINNFVRHQSPHVKEAASTIPAPCSTGAKSPESPLLNDESPSPPTEGTAGATTGDFALLESALSANGVREITSVRKWLKCSVPHAIAAVKHYASKPGAWKPEHLVARLKNLRDTQDPTDDSLWMPVSEQYAKSQREKNSPKPREVPDPGIEARKRLDALEAQYGETLNAMGDVDRNALAVGLPKFAANMYRTSGWKSVRPSLLELMRARDGPGPPPPTVRVHSPPNERAS